MLDAKHIGGELEKRMAALFKLRYYRSGGRGYMLNRGKIWTAIDALARRYGLSPSALAKRAGL